MAKSRPHNEIVLIERLAKALKQTQGVERVINRHGNREAGIDITYYQEDAFGIRRLHGIQVKDGGIKSDVMKTIIGQAAIAFGHRFGHTYNDRRLDVIEIFTPGEVSVGVDEEIMDAQIGTRNIRWVCGEDAQNYMKTSAWPVETSTL